jgi:DNA-binding transcriptional LysR family regulator
MLQKLLGAANDLIFVAGPVATPNVETAPVGSVDLVWVASPAVAGQAEAGPEALPIWLLHRHSPIHGLALSALEEAGVARPMIHICNNARMLIDLVAADAGLSLAPRPMVADKLVSGTLVQLWPELDRSIEFQVAIRRQERDPLVRALFDRAALLRIGV